jgi:L-ribulose-5-phosphate 4-epimerase
MPDKFPARLKPAMSCKPFSELREACCQTNRALAASGLVNLTFGNASLLDPDAGAFAIKPSGVPYDALTPADMVIMNLEGRILEGTLRPSSDEPTHRHLFRAFHGAGVRAIVHTHSPAAVSFAQAGVEIPVLGTTHADHFRCAVPVTRGLVPAETGADYEWKTGSVIIECFDGRNPLEVPAVLVRGHGPFTWGGSGPEALENAQALELVAVMAARTLALNPSAAPLPLFLSERHFLRKHGPGATYGQGAPGGSP